MTKSITLFITLTILNDLLAEDCILSPEPREDAWDKSLHTEVWKNYDAREPPSNQSCVLASVRINLKSFALYETEGIFTAKVWTRMNWIDERLAWSPADYGGVQKIIKFSTEIWKPSFKLIHGVYPPFFEDFYSDCSITNDGKVLCVAQLVYETFCSSVLRDWPYDVQNCTLEFGDDDTFGMTKYEFPVRVIAMLGAEYGPGWNIMAVHSQTYVSSTVQLSVTLTLERQAYGLVVIVLVPCIILSLLTFTSTLLSAKGSLRLGFSCFCLISHFIFTGTIDEFLPKHSADTPVILLFAKGSTIVTITSLLLAYVLSVMIEITTKPPAWIALITNTVTGTFGKYLLIPKWFDNLDTEDINVKNKKVWSVFANIINSIYIVVFVIVYICLFSVYMPKQALFEY